MRSCLRTRVGGPPIRWLAARPHPLHMVRTLRTRFHGLAPTLEVVRVVGRVIPWRVSGRDSTDRDGLHELPRTAERHGETSNYNEGEISHNEFKRITQGLVVPERGRLAICTARGPRKGPVWSRPLHRVLGLGGRPIAKAVLAALIAFILRGPGGGKSGAGWRTVISSPGPMRWERHAWTMRVSRMSDQPDQRKGKR